MRDIGNINQYFHRTAVFGADDRRTAERYAAEHRVAAKQIESKYLATGTLICGTNRATANLVKGNVVVTAGHITRDFDNCSDVAPSTCHFEIQSHGTLRTIEIERQLANGLKCDGKDGHSHRYDDWAVLRLAQSVDDVTPYKIEERTIKTGDNVTAVGWSMDFRTIVKRDGKPEYNFLKHYGDCGAKRVMSDDQSVPYFIITDCDGSGYTSGGGLFTGAARDQLVGIHVGSNETHDQAMQQLLTGRSIKRPFNEKSWASIYLPITGEFKAAILSAIN